MRLQVGHSRPVAKMQQIVQAAVLRSNKIGLQLQRLAICCDKHSIHETVERGHGQEARHLVWHH